MNGESKRLSGEELMKKLVENFKNKQLKHIKASQKKKDDNNANASS